MIAVSVTIDISVPITTEPEQDQAEERQREVEDVEHSGPDRCRTGAPACGQCLGVCYQKRLGGPPPFPHYRAADRKDLA
jgi:hypothetical protein